MSLLSRSRPGVKDRIRAATKEAMQREDVKNALRVANTRPEVRENRLKGAQKRLITIQNKNLNPKYWTTNGVDARYIDVALPVPTGWTKGRPKDHVRGNQTRWK